MGLNREIEKMLENPNDALLTREIIGFWAEHKGEPFSLAQISSKLHRPSHHVECLLNKLGALGVLSRSEGVHDSSYSYRLRGVEAFEVERFAESRRFHKQKLVRSTDRFRNMYQRRAHG